MVPRFAPLFSRIFHKLPIILLITLISPVIRSQSAKPSRVLKTLEIRSDSIFLDSAVVALTSIEITKDGQTVDHSQYEYHAVNGYLIWKGAQPSTVTISYRRFRFDLTQKYQKKDTNSIEPDLTNPNQIYSWSSNDNKRENPFEFGGLDKSGSISRGITFGNNQDLGVNSNLSLQLNGKVSEDISIRASITDNNIPIQPEGNTLQLQDFDQAFIQLYNDQFKLTAGDFWLYRPESYFLTYRKKAQGVAIAGSLLPGIPLDNKKGNYWNFSSGLALSKGKFSRNIIQGQEGNQGPYKLQGANNERFIIVLSGTERVFIDGKLLTRGQENDYTIDYNTAEVTFTPRNLITKDRRIIVEFQYSDKNYARSLLQFTSDYKKENWKVNFNVYSEQDSKNQPLQQTLDEEQRITLANVGDNLNAAVSQGIDSVGFSTDLTLYKKVDSLGYTDVYVYSTNEDSAFYQLSFSQVGQGNGNYVLQEFTAFGRVYRWVKPDTVAGDIVLNGDHEPVILLVPPQKRQMVTLKTEHAFSKKTKLGLEGAVTNVDLNTFSDLDANDNTGYGLQAYWNTEKNLTSDTLGWRITNNISGEFRDANFNPIERYRLVEFERNWNILGKTLSSDQLLAEADIGFSKAKTGKIGYYFNSFQSFGEFEGIKNGAVINLNKNKTRINYNGNITQTSGFETTRFIRHKSDVSQDINWVRVGYIDELEQNKFFFQDSDSLLSSSYQFHDWKAYVSNAGTQANTNRFELYYRQRKDKLNANNNLSPATSADHYGASMELVKNPKSRIKTRVEYRQLRIENDSLTNIRPDETLLGRVEYSARIKKGFVTTTTFYEIGSGQELKREFAYVQVQAGQGIYAWNDYDDDGVKDINEFEISAFPDQADYIRVFTPTNEYIKTFTNQFNQSINIRPSAIWHNKKGFLKAFARFDNQTAFRIDRKTNEESAETAYNPFITEIDDTTLVSLNSSIRNTLFFNRSNPKFGMDYTFQKVGGKSLLTSGFDSRGLEEHELRVRWNINRKFTLLSNQKLNTKSNRSDYTSGRDYELTQYSIEPKFSYQPNTSFRISIINETAIKENAVDFGGEVARIVDLGTELRFNTATKGSFTATFNYVEINYDGEVNSALGFEMLNGLKNGTNFTWNANLQRTLANNLQLSLNYLGRKSEENKAIHSGGVQVRAFF